LFGVHPPPVTRERRRLSDSLLTNLFNLLFLLRPYDPNGGGYWQVPERLQ